MFGILGKALERLEGLGSRIINYFSGKYYNFIPKLLSTSRMRARVIIGAWALFIASIVLVVMGFVDMQSFQKTNAESFYINIKMPTGTTLEKTDEVVQQVEQILLSDQEIENFSTSVGASLGSGSMTSQGNQAFIQVNLTKPKEREIHSTEIVARIREQVVPQITNAEVTMTEESSGPPTGEGAIVANITGHDLPTLEKIANSLKEEIAQIPTTIQIKSTAEYSSGELVFVPDKDILAGKRLSIIQVASELRKGIARDNEMKISPKGEEIKIDLGYAEKRITSASDLYNIEIKSPTGEKVALSQLGEMTLAPSLASIKHRNEQRVITVTADTQGGNAAKITEELKTRVSNLDLPPGYNITYGGEQQEMQEVFTDMFLKMIMGIILMLFILVIQFNSYRQVAIILFTIPLALIGVVWGMMLARLTLDIPAFIGIVSLGGIEVNNAVILIDQINRSMKRGKGLIEAAREAGAVRLRPIFLTKAIAIIGLLPLSLTQPEWQTLGFSIIFGLIFGTLLSLVVVPVTYVSFYRKKLNPVVAAENAARQA